MSRQTKKEIMSGVDGEFTSAKILTGNTVEYTRPSGARVIRFHNTDIMEFRPNGDVEFNSGGWQTVTTKDRMRRFGPDIGLHQEKRVWWVHEPVPPTVPATWQNRWEWIRENRMAWKDGLIRHPDGTITGAGRPPSPALVKQIKAYAKGFAAALPVELPDGGNCWFCALRSEDGKTMGEHGNNVDHLLSHVQEKYYVPALLWNILVKRGCDPHGIRGNIWFHYGFKSGPGGEARMRLDDRLRKDFQRWIYSHLYEILVNGKPQ